MTDAELRAVAAQLAEAWAASRLTQPTPAERDLARYLVDLLGITSLPKCVCGGRDSVPAKGESA